MQFVDISTLLTSNPDPDAIKPLYDFETPTLGGSHAAWDPITKVMYYTEYDNTNSQGWVYVLDTSGLSKSPPSIDIIGDRWKIGWGPHGIAFPGVPQY